MMTDPSGLSVKVVSHRSSKVSNSSTVRLVQGVFLIARLPALVCCIQVCWRENHFINIFRENCTEKSKADLFGSIFAVGPMVL